MVACPRFGLSVETEKGRAHYYTSTTPGSSTGLRSTLLDRSYFVSGIRSCLPAIATMHDVHGELQDEVSYQCLMQVLLRAAH